MKAKILDIDKPNANGNVYPRDVVEKAFKQYKDNLVDDKRAFIFKHNSENIEQAYGLVQDIMIEGDEGYIELKPLTLDGCSELTTLIESGMIHVVTAGMGMVNNDGVVQDDFIFRYLFLTDDPSYSISSRLND